jgi:hypothetical protein
MMKPKLKRALQIAERILWALLLAMASLPVGYMFTLFTQPEIMIESDAFIMIMGGATMIIGLGGFSYLVYRLSKKWKAKNPVRIGLSFYSIFLILFLLISYFATNSGKKQERRDHFIEKMRAED